MTFLLSTIKTFADCVTFWWSHETLCFHSPDRMHGGVGRDGHRVCCQSFAGVLTSTSKKAGGVLNVSCRCARWMDAGDKPVRGRVCALPRRSGFPWLLRLRCRSSSMALEPWLVYPTWAAQCQWHWTASTQVVAPREIAASMRCRSFERKSDHIPTRKVSVFRARSCSWEPGSVLLKSIAICCAMDCCSRQRLSIEINRFSS